MKKIGLLLILCTFLCTSVVLAYHGSYVKMDVAAVLAQGKDDQHIVMEGKITKYLHKDKYVFEDENGKSMTVEVDDHCVVTLNQKIRAYGEIDIKHGNIEVEFDQIEPI